MVDRKWRELYPFDFVQHHTNLWDVFHRRWGHWRELPQGPATWGGWLGTGRRGRWSGSWGGQHYPASQSSRADPASWSWPYSDGKVTHWFRSSNYHVIFTTALRKWFKICVILLYFRKILCLYRQFYRENLVTNIPLLFKDKEFFNILINWKCSLFFFKLSGCCVLPCPPRPPFPPSRTHRQLSLPRW